MGVVSRSLVMASVLVPFLMSAYCVFSITYLFPEIATTMRVGISALSFAVALSYIGGAIGGIVVGMLADAYGRRVGLAISIVLFFHIHHVGRPSW